MQQKKKKKGRKTQKQNSKVDPNPHYICYQWLGILERITTIFLFFYLNTIWFIDTIRFDLIKWRLLLVKIIRSYIIKIFQLIFTWQKCQKIDNDLIAFRVRALIWFKRFLVLHSISISCKTFKDRIWWFFLLGSCPGNLYEVTNNFVWNSNLGNENS